MFKSLRKKRHEFGVTGNSHVSGDVLFKRPLDKWSSSYYYYYYLFTAIGFAPGGSGPYTTQLQQNTYNKNKYTP
jgi:hypothetical protein